MRYPTKKEHPLVERLDEALYYNRMGWKTRSQKMLDDICLDLDKTEKQLGKEKYTSPEDYLDGFGYPPTRGHWRDVRDRDFRDFFS